MNGEIHTKVAKTKSGESLGKKPGRINSIKKRLFANLSKKDKNGENGKQETETVTNGGGNIKENGVAIDLSKYLGNLEKTDSSNGVGNGQFTNQPDLLSKVVNQPPSIQISVKEPPATKQKQQQAVNKNQPTTENKTNSTNEPRRDSIKSSTCSTLTTDRIPGQRSRSASRQWIEFLTEPGIQMSEEGSYINPPEIHIQSDTDSSSACSIETTSIQSYPQGDEGTSTPSKKKVRMKESAGAEMDERKTWFNNTTGEQVSSHHVDDLIFETFATKDESGNEVILMGAFLSALEKTGLRPNDSRLSDLYAKLRRLHRDVEIRYPKMIHSIEILKLDRDTFKQLINDDILLISKAFRQQFVIPDFLKFCLHIEEIYTKCKANKSGKAAAYIPQLARVDPNLFGISLCTTDGQRYSVGDTTIPFTIQSCSKSLTYGICLDELGANKVHEYVGQEPSGRMFNEIVLDQRRKPHNPMINAGAIVTVSLLKELVEPEMSLAEKFDYTYNYFKKLAGGEYIGFDNATFLSEREVADRNYALGFYMRENKCFPEGTKLKECLDFYFQICSLECNCESAAVIAATLANGGICPVSEEKILKPDSCRDVLALMHSCGMYDYSGQFAFKVGLPAKSGVSGIVMVIVPNVLGMAVWSPNLDKFGNSVRGVAFCEELVRIFNFHKYDELKNVSHKVDPRRKNFETKGLNIVNLLFSAALGDLDSIRRHHLSGMDMNVGDYDGRTALHLAAAEGHLDCVNYLINHCQLTHNPVDAWGHLPIDDAETSNHTEIVKVLQEWVPRRGKTINSKVGPIIVEGVA